MILKKFTLTFCTLLFGTSLLFVPVHAENRTEAEKKETESLLQKGLTVHEIDREIVRLAEEDVKLGGQLTDTEKKIAAQEIVVKDAKNGRARSSALIMPASANRSGPSCCRSVRCRIFSKRTSIWTSFSIMITVR